MENYKLLWNYSLKIADPIFATIDEEELKCLMSQDSLAKSIIMSRLQIY